MTMLHLMGWKAPDLTALRKGRSLMTMPSKAPTILGLNASQMTSLVKRAVSNAVASDLRAGIPVTGMVDGRVQTLDPADERLAKHRQGASSVHPAQ